MLYTRTIIILGFSKKQPPPKTFHVTVSTHPNFNVVGSGLISAAFRKNCHSGRYMSGDQSATLNWGDMGASEFFSPLT